MRIRRRSRRIVYVGLGIFVAVFLFSFLIQRFKSGGEADAMPMAGFDPGYIISDYQMSNYNSMNESQIQNFLKSMNSCNDSNIGRYTAGEKVNYFSEMSPPRTWHVKDGHFVCMADEVFDGGTAAHIIYRAAQDYQINPQVLLVLLEKEQSLVRDTFPHSQQYRSATGYGCPDTAACSSKYYGLNNQVRNAAALFRTVLNGGWTNYPLGNNYIQYNPNASCGGSVVNIGNLATSALYRYTPYQPNAGAIAAGYGTAYCGAYGNRNFYLYFEDWFGGIKDTRIVWQNMEDSRVMTVNKATLMIDADSRSLTSKWLEANENYYFTKKLSVFMGDEQQVCLQRKIDEGTNYCVLMSRLSDFSLDEKVITLPEEQQYEIEKWTCSVNLLNQEVECGEKAYAVGEVISVEKTIKIDDKEYLIIEDEHAVLKARTRLKLNYEKIGPVLMKLTHDSYKYIGGENEVIQKLNAGSNTFISIMDKTAIDGEVFYRTSHDSNKNYNYVIPEEALTNNIFTDFKYPRNLEFVKTVNSINLDNNRVCKSYNIKTIRRFTKKVVYNNEVYFQNEDEINTHCVIKASELQETIYDFDSEKTGEFVKFVSPRELKTDSPTYMIDVENGKTCEDFLQKDNTQKYTTKIKVNGIVFYRTEDKTRANSSCAVPASNLLEVI